MPPERSSNAPPDEGDLFSQLFDVSPIPMVVSRLADHTVIAINRRTSEIFDIAPSEAVGVRVSDYYVNPSERQQLAAHVLREGRADNLRIQLRRRNGETFWALAAARLVTSGGEPAVLTVFTDISGQVAAEEALEASRQRLAAQSQALTGLMARYANPGERFEDRLRLVLVVAARTLQVGRLSMWRYTAERDAIRCLAMCAPGLDQQYAGTLIYRRDVPAYFEALDRERVIAAADARTDPRTREFTASYLDPNHIGAMMDVPLHQDDATVGVLCAEHVGGSRVWTVDEQNFAIATAN